MTLLRAVPRAMLASYFVASGIKAVRDPESLVPAAEPIADRLVPLVKQYSPEQVAGVVPENTVTLVRLFGVAQVVGGAALATGKGRRLGALLLAGTLVPSTVAKHPFWTVQDPEQRAQDRSHFLKNVSVLIASVDTEGKPSLAWRAQKGGQKLGKETRKASKKLAKSTGKVAGGANELAESAVVTGVALVEALADSSRKAKKKAAKQLKEAKALAAHQAEEAQAAAAKAAKKANKQARKQAKVVSKKAKKIGENVQLGDN
jgi:uncharacterized membrane protein YphA (DoxX/SURF4 family)